MHRILVAALLFAASTSAMPQPADHHGERFRNNYSRPSHGMSWAFLRFLWELQTGDWEVPDVARETPDLAFLHGNRSDPSLTWLGHASFLLQIDGHNILTDPVLTERASPLSFAGPARVHAPGIAIDQLPRIDVVVISHDHYDHLDLPTLERLRERNDPLLVAPLRLGAWLRERGFARVVELDWWQHQDLERLRIHAVPVQHFSGRTAFDRNRRLWAGYVIEAGGRRVLFSGDTGYSRDFADIGERFAPIDLALIPIGAYDPRDFMGPVHVDPEQAVRIHRDVGAVRSVGMHWGTFRLTTEPMDEPPRRLRAAVAEAGLAADAFTTVPLGKVLRAPFAQSASRDSSASSTSARASEGSAPSASTVR